MFSGRLWIFSLYWGTEFSNNFPKGREYKKMRVSAVLHPHRKKKVKLKVRCMNLGYIYIRILVTYMLEFSEFQHSIMWDFPSLLVHKNLLGGPLMRVDSWVPQSY